MHFSGKQHTTHSGQGMVEYALIIVLIFVVIIVVMMLIGPQIGNVFSNITTALQEETSPKTMSSTTEYEITTVVYGGMQKPEHGAQVNRSKPHTLTGACRTPRPE